GGRGLWCGLAGRRRRERGASRVDARRPDGPRRGDAPPPCRAFGRPPCPGAGRTMSRLRALGAFLYDFVIGDDPLIAAAVGVALGLTAALAGAGVAAWWIVRVVALHGLGLSGRHGARSCGTPRLALRA